MLPTTAPVETISSNLATRFSRGRWATVLVATEGAVYVGRAYVPAKRQRDCDLMGDTRPFLNLVEVTINGDEGRTEPFVAINKSFVRTMRILDEDETALDVHVRRQQ